MEISERISLIIKEKNLSIRAFSKSISFADTTIGNIISGKSEPGYKVLYAICKQYDDISPAWLILGIGEMYKDEIDHSHPIPNLVSEDLLVQSQKQVDDLLNMLKQSQKQLDDVINMYTKLLEREKGGGVAHRGNDARCADAG